jgi:rubrerythrin
MELRHILSQAMQLETEGQQFYLQAAKMTDDSETQELFQRLASDEAHHHNYLQRQYAAVECGDEVCSLPSVEKVGAGELGEELFPTDKAFVGALSKDATLNDVFQYAFTVEDEAFKWYRDRANDLDHAEARQLFLQLASLEMEHFETLMQRYESHFGYPF